MQQILQNFGVNVTVTKPVVTTAVSTTPVVTTVTTAVTTTVDPDSIIDWNRVLYGDANVDGEVNSTDIVVLNKYLLNKVQYPLQDSSAYANGDCDKDKDLTTKDSLFIIQHVLGIELLN